MRRLLLLVTSNSYRAGAFLAAAARLRLAVTVGTDRRQALERLHPEGHLTLDFGTTERALSAIVDFAARHPFDAVIGADDEGVELAALVAERLGLRHHPLDAVRAARDKGRARAAFAAAGLPGPWTARVASAMDPDSLGPTLRYPCVVKPVSLGASRGVLRADDPASFAAAIRRVRAMLPPDAEILVEGYLPGGEVAVEGVVTDGELSVLAVFDKPDPLEGPTFEETIYVTPSRLAETMRHRVEARAADMVEGLGLANGPVHAELRVHDGEAWPLEVAPRSIGGLCSRVLRFEGGRSLEEVILRHALREDVRAIRRESPASAVMMIPIPAAGTLAGIDGLEAVERVPGIDEVRITIPVGDTLVPLPEGGRYLGFLFARGDEPARAEAALREAHRLLTFDVRPVPVEGFAP